MYGIFQSWSGCRVGSGYDALKKALAICWGCYYPNNWPTRCRNDETLRCYSERLNSAPIGKVLQDAVLVAVNSPGYIFPSQSINAHLTGILAKSGKIPKPIGGRLRRGENRDWSSNQPRMLDPQTTNLESLLTTSAVSATGSSSAASPSLWIRKEGRFQCERKWRGLTHCISTCIAKDGMSLTFI